MVIDDSERPRSLKAGAGNGGGGVAGRDGSGDEEREDSRGSGLEGGGVIDSRVGGKGGSRRCMRLEKKPEIRFDARVCCINLPVSVRRLPVGSIYSPPALAECSFDPARSLLWVLGLQQERPKEPHSLCVCSWP